MGFGIRWRTWVKECVTTASMSVLINGSPTKPFKMERGLKQGDPLSPFLFVLVDDVLHRMVGEAVRNSRISPLLVGRDNIELSHLQFADDTILFYPQETETLVNYKRLLRCFELMSGLSINFEKSSLISVNSEKEWVTSMCGLLGCGEAILPVSLPVYYLSLYKMPKGVAEKIIGLQRRFLWSKEDGNNGIPLVKWEVVQALKKLGVGPNFNVIKPTFAIKRGPWKDICQLNIKEQQARDMMIRGLSMEVGNGRNIRFWEDEWLQDGSLKECFPRLFSVSNQQGSVIGECGFWDGLEWVLQNETLPDDITSYNFTSSIWRGLVPPRVELFAWFVLVGRVWCAWLTFFDRAWAIPGTTKEFYESWIEAIGRKSEQRKWLIEFCAVIWNIWLEQNNRVFQQVETNVEGLKIMSFLSYKEWCGVDPFGC
ncbi:uncharacterized protein LOC107480021 [Arachis duranensis]|uniref:Uncharacterized protein LOC107480021 n=1 Tax=Arachis duranensis TaxID=130453 RepID=A0A6P4CSI8_ARADU|nr:uncharacterized protein LOC107480021 [Arachis duranensis]